MSRAQKASPQPAGQCSTPTSNMLATAINGMGVALGRTPLLDVAAGRLVAPFTGRLR